MKKLFPILLFSCSLLMTGCFLFNSSKDDKKEDNPNIKEIELNPDVTSYLVKMNTGGEILKGNKTGKVSANKKYNDSVALLQKQNELLKDLLSPKNSARTATDADFMVKKTDTKNLNYSVNSDYNFWLITGEDSEGYAVQTQRAAKCMYSGTYCYVFADTDSLTTEAIQKGIKLKTTNSEGKNPCQIIGEEFDDLYLKETDLLGDPNYTEYYNFFVPCTDKIIIMITDLYNDSKADQTGGTYGLFYSTDLLNQEFLNYEGYTNLHSNGKRMIYLDSYFLSKNPGAMYSTVPHEFNHLINFIVKTIKPCKQNFETNFCSTWYTEMLSMVTEDMLQHYLNLNDEDSPKQRLYAFDVCYNYGFTMWDTSQIDAEISYANTYAFGAFLARNFGGVDLISKIAKNAYVDERSITEALRQCYSSSASFDSALSKFPLCLINTARMNSSQALITGDGQYFSLNRESKTANDVYFDPIDISNYRITDTDGKVYNVKPSIYIAEADIDLGPAGFSVHYIGSGLKSFKIDVTNKSADIEYYLITK